MGPGEHYMRRESKVLCIWWLERKDVPHSGDFNTSGYGSKMWGGGRDVL